MNWLRTAASAYSNVTADPEWPKYDVLESNKVRTWLTESITSSILSSINSRTRSVATIHLHAQLMHLPQKQAMNLLCLIYGNSSNIPKVEMLMVKVHFSDLILQNSEIVFRQNFKNVSSNHGQSPSTNT